MIDWHPVQRKLRVKDDGIAGPLTFAHLLGKAAGLNIPTNVMLAMGKVLAAHATAYGMTTHERLCEFVAQIANETGGFKVFTENLNYSAKGLMKTWPARFTADLARQYANKPEQIANWAYGGRGGNTQPGDGWRYRGRGALQLTFRDNYREFGRLLGLDLENHPELASDPGTSVLIALLYFKRGKVNDYVDAGNYTAARSITNAGHPNHPKPIGLAEVTRIRAKLLLLFDN